MLTDCFIIIILFYFYSMCVCVPEQVLDKNLFPNVLHNLFQDSMI